MSELPFTKGDAFLEACLPGDSKELTELKEVIIRFNSQDDEVRAILLLGESGVGKTYVARVIAMHRCWQKSSFLKSQTDKPTAEEVADLKLWYVRSQGAGILRASGEPFREVPLPLLEGTLARSWLFGHKKGAFTGAIRDHSGFLGDESVTDVLLDEIGYASVEMQRTLLQVIQSGDFYKVGSTKRETTEARLMFATNQHLDALVRKGEFQEDLWWRLTDHVLHIPPLRERRSEVKAIASRIVAALNAEHVGGDGSGNLHLGAIDLEWAESHSWPGNIRELEKTVRRWFFYRGSRPLREVSNQIAPFIPLVAGAGAAGNILTAAELRAALQVRIEAALAANESLGSLQGLLNEYVNPVRHEAAQIVTACIDALKLKGDNLVALFPDMASSSIGPWLSRHREKLQ